MTRPPGPAQPPPRTRAQAVGVVLAALAVYAPALAGGFVYDDYVLVEANPWIRSPGGLGEAFTQQLFGFVPGATASAAFYRPLVHVLLSGVHAVSGAAAWGYHLVPVLLHAVASLLVWALARRLLEDRAPGAALAAGLLFAVHPVHVEAVAWVSAVMDVSATTAGLGMLWLLAVRPLAPGRAVAGAALWLVALLFKEVAVVLPLMLLAWEAVADGAPGAGRWRERAWRYGPLAGAAAVYLALRLSAVGWATVNTGWDGVPPGVALLNALPLLAHYARLLVLPGGLSVFHPFEPATSLADGRVLAGLAVALAVVAGLALLRRRAPAAWLGLAWAVTPLLPALHLRALGESPVAERYAYLPSVGFCLLAAAAWGAWARRTEAPRRLVPALAGVALLVAGTALTEAQVGVWQDEVSLWANAAEVSPESSTPMYQLGATLLRAGDVAEALPALERAVVLRPTDSAAVGALARALLQAGQPARARELLEAALPGNPDHAGFHLGLGHAQRALGDTAAAIRSFREAARLDPSSEAVRVALAEAQASLAPAGKAAPAGPPAGDMPPSAPREADNGTRPGGPAASQGGP